MLFRLHFYSDYVFPVQNSVLFNYTLIIQKVWSLAQRYNCLTNLSINSCLVSTSLREKWYLSKLIRLQFYSDYVFPVQNSILYNYTLIIQKVWSFAPSYNCLTNVSINSYCLVRIHTFIQRVPVTSKWYLRDLLIMC